jgi:hypothetical protein
MKGIIWDAMALAGVGVAVAGVGFIHWQTAMIFGGIGLTAFALMGARLAAKPRIANSTSKAADEPTE